MCNQYQGGHLQQYTCTYVCTYKQYTGYRYCTCPTSHICAGVQVHVQAHTSHSHSYSYPLTPPLPIIPPHTSPPPHTPSHPLTPTPTYQCQEVLLQLPDGDHGLHPQLAALAVHESGRHPGSLHRHTEAALEHLCVCVCVTNHSAILQVRLQDICS